MRATPKLLLAALIAALSAQGCVHVYRGAIVQMNFRTLDSNRPGEHYELFANVREGAVPVGRFKVLDAIDHSDFPPADGIARESCGGDRLVTRDVQLVQLFAEDYSTERQCSPAERIGTIDKLLDGVNLILAGGVRLDTEVELADADSLFLSIVPDDGTDTTGLGEVVLHADVAEHQDPLACAYPDGQPPPRRGVLLGSFVPAIAADPEKCPYPTGRVAIVPAEDETTL